MLPTVCARPRCGKALHGDTTSLRDTLGQRVRLACVAGHSIWLETGYVPPKADRVVEVVGRAPGKWSHRMPAIPCKGSCGGPLEDHRQQASYCIPCGRARNAEMTAVRNRAAWRARKAPVEVTA